MRVSLACRQSTDIAESPLVLEPALVLSAVDQEKEFMTQRWRTMNEKLYLIC